MIKAVIFDFDGVIGDTMYDNCIAWQSTLAGYDIQIDPKEYYVLEGMGRREIARFFISKYQLDPSIQESVVEEKERRYMQKNTFRIYPQVFPILEILEKKKIAKAIVTGSSHVRIYNSVDPDFLGRFTALVTADDVKIGKPDPYPYLQAIHKLGVAPAQCIVVENAILGIRSAKAAGCTCYAIETTLDRTNLEGADKIFSNHEELLEEIKTLFA